MRYTNHWCWTRSTHQHLTDTWLQTTSPIKFYFHLTWNMENWTVFSCENSSSEIFSFLNEAIVLVDMNIDGSLCFDFTSSHKHICAEYMKVIVRVSQWGGSKMIHNRDNTPKVCWQTALYDDCAWVEVFAPQAEEGDEMMIVRENKMYGPNSMLKIRVFHFCNFGSHNAIISIIVLLLFFRWFNTSQLLQIYVSVVGVVIVVIQVL